MKHHINKIKSIVMEWKYHSLQLSEILRKETKAHHDAINKMG